MGSLWGLMAALTWGVGDFLIKPAAMRLGALRAAFFVELASLLPLGGYYLLAGAGRGDLLWVPFALALLIGAINFLATLALYRAYQIGQLSILAPIVSTFSVFTVILALLVLAERPSARNGLGIALTLGGVALVSTSWSDLRHLRRLFSEPGVGWGLASAVGLGLAFFLVDYVVDDLGHILPVIAFRLAGVFGLLAARPLFPMDLKLPAARNWWLLGALVLTDTMGYLTYNIGISTAYVSLVSTLSSLYALISVALALIFLGERLEVNHRLGILVVTAGVVLVLS